MPNPSIGLVFSPFLQAIKSAFEFYSIAFLAELGFAKDLKGPDSGAIVGA
jgi:hypothetical protein